MPVFSDYPQFTPNLTPKQMFQSGIFGGTYFGSIHSQVTWKEYTDAHKEFPTDRFAWVVVTDTTYDRKKNKYLVKCSTPSNTENKNDGFIHKIHMDGYNGIVDFI